MTLTARELRPDIQIVARAASRVLGAQADPRGRERGRLALQGERAHDGEPRARSRTAAGTSPRARHRGAVPSPSRHGCGDVSRGIRRPAVAAASGAGRAAAGAEVVGRRAAAVRGGDGEAPQPTLERPPRAEFGDYSTNVAMLLAPALQGAAARDRGARRRGAERGPGRRARARRGRGPGLPQPVPVRRLVPRRAREPCASRATRSARGRPGRAARADPASSS